ncbi:MAG: LptF/LptG family permease [Candidatus Omnitrophica bacterium]|nr:LptF/LptG family permease [Candidatus Omnitrophota bacterium]
MRLLEQYILRGFLAPWFWSTGVFVTLYVVIDLFDNLEDVLKAQVPFLILLEYYASLIPFIVVQTIPLAVLVATIYSLSYLNRNYEIVAMRAGGIPLLKILQPLLLFTFFISGAVLWINETYVPNNLLHAQSIREEYIEARVEQAGKKVLENVTIYGSNNTLFHLGQYNLAEEEFTHLTLLKQNEDQKPVSKIIAQSGNWAQDHWELKQVFVFQLGPRGQVVGPPEEYKTYALRIAETPADFAKGEARIEYMNIAALLRHLRTLRGTSPAVLRRLEAEWNYRLSLPLTSLIMVILGAPFALGYGRKASLLTGVALSFGLAVMYFSVTAVGMALGKGGFVPAWLGPWLGHILFGALGLGLLRRVR